MGKVKYDSNRVIAVFSDKTVKSVFVTTDGNIFRNKNKSFCLAHCREFKQTYEEITREQFEQSLKGAKGSVKNDADKTTGQHSSTPSKDWKDGKWDEIIAFAKSKGLDAKTLKNKGKVALIAEVEAFLNESEDDYTPVGGSGTPSTEGVEGSEEGEGSEGDTNNQNQ